MNKLKGSIFYLAGPMDRIPDRGVEWREDMQLFLWDDIGAGVFNPCDKPISWGTEDENSRQWRTDSLKKAETLHRLGHKHEADKIYDVVCDNMKDVVASDLGGVDKSDAVILYVDLDVHMCGSYNEQTHGCLQRKPVIVCCKQGKYQVPHWLLGICNHNMFFNNWDEVKKYIRHVAFSPKIEHYKRWKFFDYEKIYGRKRI